MSDPDNLIRLPTDTALAAEVRAELTPLLEQICVVMNRAKAAGLVVGFNCNADQYGRHRPAPIDVMRPL